METLKNADPMLLLVVVVILAGFSIGGGLGEIATAIKYAVDKWADVQMRKPKP